MSDKNKIWLALAASFLLTCLGAFYLPVEFRVYAITVAGAVRAEGPITPSTPFEYCPSASMDNPTTLKVFLATYNRTNTTAYDFDLFSIQNGHKVNVYHEQFSASGVADNQFHSFNIPPGAYPPKTASGAGSRPFCFSLTSKDATNQNALTVILNQNSEPIFEVWRQGTLGDLIEKTWLQKEWNTGKALGYGVFIICFTAQLFFCVYILFSMNEKKQ